MSAATVTDLPGGTAPVRPAAGVGRTRGTAIAVLRRLGAAVFVLWGTVTVTWIVLSVLPGDRATIVLNVQSGQTTVRSAAEIATVNAQYGWDRPAIVQYFDMLLGLFRGDLGTSWELRRPVSDVIAEQFGPTITLAVVSLLLAWVLSVPWTLFTAGRGRVRRTIGSAAETVAAGLPQYWVGIILLLVFAVGLGWFPVLGGAGPWATVLPAFTLAIPLAGFIGQATRNEFERAVRQPFVLSARTRGMSESETRRRHVLRHALIPGITLSGWAIGASLSGAVLVESVYGRPGLGSVLVTAVSDKDLELVTGIVVLISLVYVVVNLLVDPRLGGTR